MVRHAISHNHRSDIPAQVGSSARAQMDPENEIGGLFHDVQNNRLYVDGKTFVDLVPRQRMRQIQQDYSLESQDPAFDLRDFVLKHFYPLNTKTVTYKANPHNTISQHIDELWTTLEQHNQRNQGSLIGLPNSYIVPGGRFREQFYWDSYFIMLGLAASNKWSTIEGMVENCTYMIRRFGFIPNANRTYCLSRSQPPFFSHMVRLLARHKGQDVLVDYLPHLLKEYRFWMKGRSKLATTEHKAFTRVVEMPNGVMLNRYYDNKTSPRPESLREDTTAAKSALNRQPDRLFLHLRAAAESGWDFSSRWFMNNDDISTIHTADIIPIDLNCLLYDLEKTIAEACRLSLRQQDAKQFELAAERRANTINKYCWDSSSNFYFDYNFHKNHRTPHFTLAAAFPLYSGIATSSQAKSVAHFIEKEFLKSGGLLTSLTNSGQQWDAPNGWAPLHWVVIQGLRNYGHHTLAREIKSRWLKTNLKVFHEEKRLVEKYNVVDSRYPGTGGEYPLQDGFGWTNGVLAALLNE